MKSGTWYLPSSSTSTCLSAELSHSSSSAPQATPEPQVCAVVITYHPSATMIGNLTSILAQTQGLVVVDNGSKDDCIQVLRTSSRSVGFTLIENEENLGIAEALNQGVQWAMDQGFSWVILFDQDSQITDNFVDRMFATLQAHPQSEKVAGIHPRYVNPDTGIEPAVYRASDGGPVSSMTSGALMPIWIFQKIGLFPSDYFIDQVDTEYGFRTRAAGYLLADSRDAVLHHKPGHPRQVKFLGFCFEPTHHNAVRRYYFTRNRVVFYRQYFRRFPRWVLHMMYISLREALKCFIAEQDRVRKFRNVLLGIWDGLTGKMGKREGI